ncbi:MAG: hypothetical protein ACYCVH_03855 [Ignavibacteriaceae bacterium]
MKIFATIIFASVLSASAFAQYSVRAGMGISFVSSPSLIDYINENFAPSDQQLGSFNSAINFSGEFDYSVNETYQVGLDLTYLLNSYTYSSIGGIYKMNYEILMPTLVNYYVISGEGYSFKFGGGVGLRFVNVSEQLPATPSATTYTSTGFGFLLRADANTLLSKNLYANIGADLKYDINGKPNSGGKYLVNNNANYTDVNFNMFSAVIRLGLTYNF